MFLTTKNIPGGTHMTQHLQINLEPKQIQALIDSSVKDDASKLILTTVFNQLMEHQRTNLFRLRVTNDPRIEWDREMATTKKH